MPGTAYMAQFVDAFFQQALFKEVGIGRETVKLFPKTMKRDDGTAPSKLGFAKQVSKDRNE